MTSIFTQFLTGPKNKCPKGAPYALQPSWERVKPNTRGCSPPLPFPFKLDKYVYAQITKYLSIVPGSWVRAVWAGRGAGRGSTGLGRAQRVQGSRLAWQKKKHRKRIIQFFCSFLHNARRTSLNSAGKEYGLSVLWVLYGWFSILATRALLSGTTYAVFEPARPLFICL